MHVFTRIQCILFLQWKAEFSLALWILLACVPLASQHTLMRVIDVIGGLVCNQVRSFYQDQKGFIWILTWEGLSRFDGSTFRNYTVADGLAFPLTNAIIVGKEGRIYIAENDGSVDVILDGG